MLKIMKTPEIGSHVNGIGKLIHRQDGVFIFERTAARAEIRLAGEILQVIQTLDDSERSYIHALYEAKRQYWDLRVAVGRSGAEGLDDTF